MSPIGHLVGLLEPIGITGPVEGVYLALLAAASATVVELAQRTGAPESVIRSSLAFLEERGLATRTPHSETRYVAAPPDVAVEGAILQKQESLRSLRQGLSDLVALHRAARGRTASELVEVVTGTAAINLRFNQLQLGAQREVLVLTRPPLAGTNNAGQDQAADRGVRFRGVYDRDYLSIPGALDVVAHWVAHGEEARAAERLPVKLAIVDRSVAMVPLVPESASMETGALVVHGSGLLDALVALFEGCWNSATPLRLHSVAGDAPTTGNQVSEDDLRLLSLLLAGLTDSAMAAQLDISERTILRRLRALMQSLEVTTRVQLGYEVARRGLLAEPVPHDRAPSATASGVDPVSWTPGFGGR